MLEDSQENLSGTGKERLVLTMGKHRTRYYLVIKEDNIEVYDDWDICQRFITGVENLHYKISDKNQLTEAVRHFYSHGKSIVVHFKGHRRNDSYTPDDFCDFIEAYKSV